MALHTLLGMEIGVPEPEGLDAFYAEIGLSGGKGAWGGEDWPGQIRVVEAPYRQLISMRIACETEEDLASAESGISELGVASRRADGGLEFEDPINGWRVRVEPAEKGDVAPQPERVRNRPGVRARTDARADLIVEQNPRPPRRLGHIVVGSPKPLETTPIYRALGFRVSDVVGGGIATFMRCSPDHHNLLIAPGRVPYLNHYALEHDDFDSVARAATLYLRNHEDDRQVAGPGRHQIGGNEFWYMLDPSGNIFEFFSDMDRIEDDESWKPRDDWDLEDSWSLWGEKRQPEIFFNPPDMDAIVAGYEKAQAG
ncbi:MAG: VOC family protein [Myxococcota bacterium]